MSVALSFIVPVRNDAVRLRRCLDTIRANVAAAPAEIIVVDNGSVDDSAAVARDAGARVLVMPEVRVSVLRNAGARAATADLLAFVDADHELAPGWRQAASAIFTDDTVGAAGAQYHAPADGTWVQGMYDGFRRRLSGHQPVGWLPSGNLVVRRSAFESIQGFDESLVTCEDVDFCQRLRAKGWQLLEAEELRSVHHGDPATLGALFRGELWRGQDNFRVSVRAFGGLRDLPSIAFPVATLCGLLAVVGGLIAWPFVGPFAVGAGVVLLTLLLAVRTVVLFRRTSTTPALRRLFQAMFVAGTYDLARAFALVVHPSHEVRQSSASRHTPERTRKSMSKYDSTLST